MSKPDFVYYGPDREPLCGACVDELYGDPHEHGGNMPDGNTISWEYLPEEGPTTCSVCGGKLPGAATEVKVSEKPGAVALVVVFSGIVLRVELHPDFEEAFDSLKEQADFPAEATLDDWYAEDRPAWLSDKWEDSIMLAVDIRHNFSVVGKIVFKN